MRKIQRTFIAIVFALSFIFIASTAANAQAMSSYLFLEVVDSNQRPVTDANVETTVLYDKKIVQTNGQGQVRTSWMVPPIKPPLAPSFLITKPDYFSFQDFGGIEKLYNRDIKVELLKIPADKKERKVIGNEQLKREFFNALQNGDIKSARKLLESGISPNLSTGDLRGISGYENIPAIVFPAVFGNGAMIKTLLEAGADARKKDKYIPKILSYYFRASVVEGLRFKTSEEKAKILKDYDEGLNALIKAGVDVNADIEGISPLGWAISYGLVSSVKILIANGANVNAKDYAGRTVLEFARQVSYAAGSQEIIKLLEAAGAR